MRLSRRAGRRTWVDIITSRSCRKVRGELEEWCRGCVFTVSVALRTVVDIFIFLLSKVAQMMPHKLCKTFACYVQRFGVFFRKKISCRVVHKIPPCADDA